MCVHRYFHREPYNIGMFCHHKRINATCGAVSSCYDDNGEDDDDSGEDRKKG